MALTEGDDFVHFRLNFVKMFIVQISYTFSLRFYLLNILVVPSNIFGFCQWYIITPKVNNNLIERGRWHVIVSV